MDGKPQVAFQTIQATRLPELPAAIKRARILLEARALSDLSRTDLALDVIAGESGRRSSACAPTSCGPAGAGATRGRSMSGLSARAGRTRRRSATASAPT